MEWRIGTMGFSYSDWVPAFYPKGTRPGDFLAAYASVYDTLELDTTFHAVPPPDRVQKWADTVPDGFVFCPKTPKQITHENPIAFGSTAMRHFLRALTPMRKADKLGPILIQFPPTFTITEFKDLELFLKELPTDDRFAVEFRNDSWEHPRTGDLLSHYRCAWVTGDYAVDPFPIHPTTNFLYLRLIGLHEQFTTHERERIDMTDRLAWWQEQVTALTPAPLKTFTMINNDYAGHAPATIDRLRTLVGLPVRTPSQNPAAAQQPLF